MTSRRDFLGWSLAAAAFPGAAMADGGLRQATAAGVACAPLYKAVYDQRHRAAIAFARAIERRGVTTRAFDGDITDVWFNDLSRRWRDGPAAVAGLTPPQTLVLLEQLAWEHRMRAVFRAEHRLMAGGAVEHRLWGPERLLRRLDAGCPSGWIPRMADLAVGCPVGRASARAYAERRMRTGAADDAPLDGALVSWVIAPVWRPSEEGV